MLLQACDSEDDGLISFDVHSDGEGGRYVFPPPTTTPPQNPPADRLCVSFFDEDNGYLILLIADI